METLNAPFQTLVPGLGRRRGVKQVRFWPDSRRDLLLRGVMSKITLADPFLGPPSYANHFRFCNSSVQRC